MMNASDSSPSSLNLGPLEPVRDHYNKYARIYRQQLDRSAPHVANRWFATAGILTVFMIRIVIAQGVSCSQSSHVESC